MQFFKVCWTDAVTGARWESVVSYSASCVDTRMSLLKSQGHKEVGKYEFDSFSREGRKGMAKKVVETVECDACAKKGEVAPGSVPLSIGEDTYDLCEMHGSRFREWFADLLRPSQPISKTA